MSSPSRHDAPCAGEPEVRAYAVTHPPGAVVLPQPAGWDQLVYAARGAPRVVTPDGVRVVPPDRAVWVPDGVQHRIEIGRGRASLRTLYLRAGVVPLPPGCRTVDVGPLLREVVLAVVVRAPVWLERDAAAARLVGVLVDEVVTAVRSGPEGLPPLPLPEDLTARAVATALLDPVTSAPDGSLAGLCSRHGASRRTVERRFVAETGLTLGRWRTRARLLDAVGRLVAGEPVGRVAAAVGYATPSAFAASFRSELGVPPSTFTRPRRDEPKPRSPGPQAS